MKSPRKTKRKVNAESVAAAERSAGRPLSFDPDAALDAAMHVFWRHGYEGTSFAMLLEAMGINRSSCYATFGDKESLFKRVVERYSSQANHLSEACAKSTAREAVEAFLIRAAEQMADPQHEGCLLVTSCLAGSEDVAGVKQQLIEARQQAVKVWRTRFKRAVHEGDLPVEADTKALAQLVMALSAGLTVQARSGATRKELLAIVKLALAAWPYDKVE